MLLVNMKQGFHRMLIRIILIAACVIVFQAVIFMFLQLNNSTRSCVNSVNCAKVLFLGVYKSVRTSLSDVKAQKLTKTFYREKHGASSSQERDASIKCPPTGLNNQAFRGRLNVHVWYGWCGCTVDDLRRDPDFPYKPTVRGAIRNFATRKTTRQFLGKRIFGYIHPPKTGSYKFAIASDDGSELWLSTDRYPSNSRLIAYVGEPDNQYAGATDVGEFSKYLSQISTNISLQEDNVYFIEAYHKQKGDSEHMEVTWQIPGTEQLETITTKHISMYMADKPSWSVMSPSRAELCLNRQDPSVHIRFNKYMSTQLPDIRDTYFITAPIIDHSDVKNVLDTCSYTTLRKTNVSQFDAHMSGMIRHSKVYPSDHTDAYKSNGPEDISIGNEVIQEKEAREVVTEYMEALKRRKGDTYELVELIQLESREHHEAGRRYLLEMELMEKSSGQAMRLSEHVYRKDSESKLCSPSGFDWRQDVNVYMVITVMNYGKWITDLVRQLSKLYHSGIERNFYLVVIDFNSTDIDMRRMLENSGISDRYFLIKKKGPFYKTQALNEGAALIKDPHSIVFTMDLHLKLPADIFDAIRKHTLEGLTLFVPKLVKLKCGYSPQYPQGGWDTLGYGLLGIYKTDWDRIGGMNEVEFKHKWGGEDWEIMDRAIAAGLEPQRICLPHLYHMFHSREQDWYEEARL